MKISQSQKLGIAVKFIEEMAYMDVAYGKKKYKTACKECLEIGDSNTEIKHKEICEVGKVLKILKG